MNAKNISWKLELNWPKNEEGKLLVVFSKF